MKQLFTGAILAAFSCGAVFCQTAERPAFEVADIQVHTETEQQPQMQFLPGGRVDIRNMPLKQLILASFNVGQGVANKLVEGIPAWADTERFDIIAKADPKTSINTLRVMLETLLEDRFKMAIHREDKVMPVYALIPNKGTNKLKPAASKDPFACQGGQGTEGNIHIDCTGVTMVDLAKSLSTFAPRYFDIPIVNSTDIAGSYDLSLEWTPVGGGPAQPSGPNAPQHAGSSDGAEIAGNTIFDAVLNLGFKLDKRKMPYPVVIVERIEKRPTEQ